MLKKYVRLFELMQDILKIASFNEQAFSYPILADHKLIGMMRKEGYMIGIFSESQSMNVFAIQTQNVIEPRGFKACSVNARFKTGGCTNIQHIEKMEIYNTGADVEAVPISNNININTDEGLDEAFQLSTIYPMEVVDMWTLASHYKNHGLSNLYHLSWAGHLPEKVIGMMILKLQAIKKELLA